MRLLCLFILSLLCLILPAFVCPKSQETDTIYETNRKESEKIVQSIHFNNDETILCLSEKPDKYSSENNVKCVMRINNFPNDSKFEFWFNDGSSISMNKDKFVSIISSQSKDKN